MDVNRHWKLDAERDQPLALSLNLNNFYTNNQLTGDFSQKLRPKREDAIFLPRVRTICLWLFKTLGDAGMIIEISVAVIALAFVALTVYLIALTITLRRTAFQADRMLHDLRRQLDEMGGTAARTIEHTNRMSFDLQKKLEALDPLFNALSNIGDFCEHKTSCLKKEGVSSSNKHQHGEGVCFVEEEPVSRASIQAADVFEFIDVGLRLWQKIKKRRGQ